MGSTYLLFIYVVFSLLNWTTNEWKMAFAINLPRDYRKKNDLWSRHSIGAQNFQLVLTLNSSWQERAQFVIKSILNNARSNAHDECCDRPFFTSEFVRIRTNLTLADLTSKLVFNHARIRIFRNCFLLLCWFRSRHETNSIERCVSSMEQSARRQ